MIISIVDCYTDEPSGLGVPPYLGTYPRYIAGKIKELGHEFYYLRIDDLRYSFVSRDAEINHKTNIYNRNRTKNAENTAKILKESDFIIIIAGIHTPGKYLAAMPGSVNEVLRLLQGYNGKKILTGPAAFATLQSGGRILDKEYKARLQTSFDYIVSGDLWDILPKLLSKKAINPDLLGHYDSLKSAAIAGAEILNQIRQPAMIELETARGCPRKPGCSFCLEPHKCKPSFRKTEDIIEEVAALKAYGAEFFRLGKQADFYSLSDVKKLLEGISRLNPRVLHIDNADPVNVLSDKGQKITQLIIKYCTSGNVAAFGAESFDPQVIEANNLNSTSAQTMEAIKAINKAGSFIGENGAMHYLPGINIILGLIGESRATLEKNLDFLSLVKSQGLLLRRINIRQVDVFPGTMIYDYGLKSVKKNKKHYFSFIRKVREDIDNELLKKAFPKGQILRDVYMEIHDGNHTFGRQFGSYPIVIGIEQRLELNRFYDVKITKHMLRSITAEPIQISHQAILGNP